jgi:hypothetical protein
MTLTDRQATNLEMEFLQSDLGRLGPEMPISTIKRELTRALYERVTADEGICPRPIIPAAHAAIEDTVRAVVGALDKVVTAWERPGSGAAFIPRNIVDGVRTAAAIISEAAERAGLTMPVQPTPVPPHEAGADPEPAGADQEPTTIAARGHVNYRDPEDDEDSTEPEAFGA